MVGPFFLLGEDEAGECVEDRLNCTQSVLYEFKEAEGHTGKLPH